MLAVQSGPSARGQAGSVVALPPHWPYPACPCWPLASALLPCCTILEQRLQLALVAAVARPAGGPAAAAVGTVAPAAPSLFEIVSGTGGSQMSHFPGSLQSQVPGWHYALPPAAHSENILIGTMLCCLQHIQQKQHLQET